MAGCWAIVYPQTVLLIFYEDIPTPGIKKQSWEAFTVEVFTARAATINPVVKRKWIDIDNQLIVSVMFNFEKWNICLFQLLKCEDFIFFIVIYDI